MPLLTCRHDRKYRPVPASGCLAGRLHQVVQQQELGDRQRLAALAAVQLAEEAGQLRALPEARPDRLLQHPAVLARRVPVDVQRVDRPAVLVPGELEVHGRAAAGQHAAEVRVADRGPQQQFRRQRRARGVVTVADGGEAHDDVRPAPLRPDELLRLRFPAAQLGEHLLPPVPALGGVPLDLPLPPDRLGRVEVDRHVEARRGEPGVQRQQPLHDDEVPWFHVLRPGQPAGVVVIDGLEYRVAGGQELQVLLHDVDVVAAGVQRGERQAGALLPVVAVVVVDADGGAAVGAERADQAGGDRRLARRAVAGDREHDRAAARGARPVHAHELVRHPAPFGRPGPVFLEQSRYVSATSPRIPPKGGRQGEAAALVLPGRRHLSCSVMEARPVRVVLVDDHEMVLEGLKAMLARFAVRVRVVGQAGTAAAAQSVVTALRPDVVLCDIRLRESSGLDLCRRLTEQDPGCRVLLLSVYDDEQYLYQALRAGAAGYLLKRVSGEELVRSLEDVHAGQTVVDGTLAARVASSAARLDSGEFWPGARMGLTQRESEVLGLVVAG